MGYTNKIVLINNVTISAQFPFGLVQTETAKATIPLNQGQTVTFGRVFVQITTPPHLIDATCSVYWNGSFIGNIIITNSINTNNSVDYLNGTGSLDITNLIDPTGKNNVLAVKCDGGGASLDFTVYADFFYELSDNNKPGQDPSITEPPNNNPPNGGGPFQWPTFDQAKPYIVVVGALVGAAIIVPPIIKKVI